jgi:hypothetical protein
MTELHPMIPPNILLNNWESDWVAEREHADVLLIQAYQAGADAELDACCDVLKDWGSCLSPDLRAARRPKPLSLKEQALAVVENSAVCDHLSIEHAAILRRALESLPN